MERRHGLPRDKTTAKPHAQWLRWRRQLQTAQQMTLVPWTDGRCYELSTQGPCASNEKLAVLWDTMRPGCVKPATELDLFSSKKSTTPPPCKTDHRGECVDSVDVQMDDPSFGFEAQLRESVRDAPSGTRIGRIVKRPKYVRFAVERGNLRCDMTDERTDKSSA